MEKNNSVMDKLRDITAEFTMSQTDNTYIQLENPGTMNTKIHETFIQSGLKWGTFHVAQ